MTARDIEDAMAEAIRQTVYDILEPWADCDDYNKQGWLREAADLRQALAAHGLEVVWKDEK